MTLLTIISILFLLLIIGYATLLAKYKSYFSSIPVFEPAAAPSLSSSVIIPARNEAGKIDQCMQALQQQQLPASEIIVVDDHSHDNTAAIAASAGARVISMGTLRESETPDGRVVAFKKLALATGIQHASGDMILTTDADCIVPKEWTRIMSARLSETNAVMVAGPVRMVPANSFLSKFQSMDFAILQGITAASVHAGFHDMSSGANLGYLKSAFNNVGGFTGIDDIATGDDMLLMQKFSAAFPGRISYAFNPRAIVDTNTEPSWSAFLKQRIRWASKATRYRDKKIFYILLLVYLLNLSLLTLLLMAFNSPTHFFICLAAFTLKTIAEWGFVSRVLHFFKLQKLMPLFPIAQPFHVIYTVLSGTFGQAGPVEWKGRKVK